jgi:hypothetical protein
LADKGLDFCAEGEEGQDGQMNLNEFAECRPMNEGQNRNNNNNNNNYNNANYQMYYIGAYCTSKGVFAGVFTDSTCTTHAPSGTYEKYNYGYSLPTKPLASTACLSCNPNNGNNNNNNGYNYDGNGNGISETCERLYEQSLKCESNLKNVQWQDTSGCEMIHTILPKLNSAFKSIKSPPVAKIFAWIFGVGFFALAGYLYLLHRKVIRQKKELEAMGYGEAPASSGGVGA